MHRIPIGVLGASGYAGRELCALVRRHPNLTLAFATANEQAGRTVELPGGGEVTFVATDQAPLGEAQLIFSSLPHGASKQWVERASAAGASTWSASGVAPGGGAGSPGCGLAPVQAAGSPSSSSPSAAALLPPQPPRVRRCWDGCLPVVLMPMARYSKMVRGSRVTSAFLH